MLLPTSSDQGSSPQTEPPASVAKGVKAASSPISGTYHSIPLPEGTSRVRIKWLYLAVFILFHLTLPLAFMPWFFSWTGLALIPIGNYVFCSTGIGLCYHRLLTHQGLQLPKWLEHFFALLGVCCLMESPARWVAIHRMHHKHSDEQPDPHSPLAGFWWGHFEWLIYPNPATSTADVYDRFAKDILRDPFYMWLEHNHPHGIAF